MTSKNLCKPSFSRELSSDSNRSFTGRRHHATRDHILSWYIPRNVNGSRDYSAHDRTVLESSNHDDRIEVSSPLHDNSKQMWTLKYSDDEVRSLPFPPPHKPKLHKHEAPHANNLPNVFKPSNYPASVLYSRYGIPLFPNPYQFDRFNYQLWSNNPLQSMFAQVGGAQRRHFTVAPDWRHLSRTNHQNYYHQ